MTHKPTEAEVEALARVLVRFRGSEMHALARAVLENGYEPRSDGQRCDGSGFLTVLWGERYLANCPGCRACGKETPMCGAQQGSSVCRLDAGHDGMHRTAKHGDYTTWLRSDLPEPKREVSQRELDAFNRGRESCPTFRLADDQLRAIVAAIMSLDPCAADYTSRVPELADALLAALAKDREGKR